MKFVVEIDSAGKNFSRPARKEVIGNLNTTFLAKELNSILVANGYAFNVPVDMDIRVISSYLNNNERLASSPIRLKITPYKVPPRVAPPSSNTLYLEEKCPINNLPTAAFCAMVAACLVVL